MEELKQIAKILGLNPQEELSTDEIISWLSQVTLVLLIVFIIANFLFAERAKLEIEAVKGQLGVLQGKYDYISKTPKGEISNNLEQALMDLQKQKLLLALEEIVFDIRNSFGLSHFGTTNAEGEKEYLLSDILSQGKVINERFKRGCILAKQALSDQKRMRGDLLSRVLVKRGMVLSDSPIEESIVPNPEKVTRENAGWLLSEISNRVKAIYTDCCIMQKTALACLMEYYQDHIDILMDSQLSEQLDQALAASEQERIGRISEFSREFYRHVKSLFDKQDVPLLSDV